MAEHFEEPSGSSPQKKRRLHIGLAECMSYSHSLEGSASLRQPIDRRAPSREPHIGLLPQHRTKSNRTFKHPRRVADHTGDVSQSQSQSGLSDTLSQDVACASQHASQNESNADNSQSSAANDAVCDQFESDGDESELVAQSNDKSIQLLSVLGGFTSAADVHRRPNGSASWTQSNQFAASSTNSNKSSSARNCFSAGPSGQQRKSVKQWQKDPNQQSIMQFMTSRPGEPSANSSSSTFNASGNGGKGCAYFWSPAKSTSSHTSSCSPNDRVAYSTPGKMYSPLKRVSDHIYITISDEDSPNSEQRKTKAESGASQASSTSSIVKKLFDGQKAANANTSNSASSFESSKKTSHSQARGGHLSAMTRDSNKLRSKSKAQPGKRGVKRQRVHSFFSSAKNSVSESTVKLNDVTFSDSDEDFQTRSLSYRVCSEVPAVKREVEVGKTFGLLGDSKVKVVTIDYFHFLPRDIVENIFCRLPMLDLCLNTNRVCLAWNDIISDEKFIPWKKLYHRLKLDVPEAKGTVGDIISSQDMEIPSLRLLRLISYMQSFKPVSKDNNMCELLQQHPKYRWAVALLKERASHCVNNQEPNPWSLLCTLVLLSATVEDVSLCLRLLTSARSHMLSTEVLECLYCIATFLLAFKVKGQANVNGMVLQEGLRYIPVREAKQCSTVSDIHYRLFYALYLFENASSSNHSMLQEVMSGQSGQQSIVRYSRGETEVRLTHEQMRIIRYSPDVATGEVIKIFAFAGSGKTTTLVRYAQMRPNQSFLLLVFNKSVCEHAKTKFPPNVTCKTGHGLAFGYTGRKYAAEKQLSYGNLRVYDIMTGLPRRPEGQTENTFIRAKQVMTTLKNFMCSADEAITTRHTPEFILNDNGVREPIPHEKRMLYAQDAELYWNRMKELRDRLVKMTHDGYLKLYQLSKPRLGGYDIILVDEAQDLTPAVLDIVQRQRQPKVFVGDQHQQIYSFRGAVNAMSGVQANKVFYLTQSFRFGPEVSHIANTMLETLKGEKHKTLVGHGTPGKINGEAVGQVTILCRTNFQLFAEAVILCVYSDQPIKISIVGGLDSFGFMMLEDIYTLMMPPEDRIKENRVIHNTFIATFANIGELEKYAQKTVDVELLGKIRIVQTYNHNLPQCITRIKQKYIRDHAQADVVLSTVHKAKGLEFSTVKVTDDFLDLKEFLESGAVHARMVPLMIPVEEANLMYVAVTRAKHALIMSESVYALFTKIGGGGVRPVLSEQLRKEGVGFVCFDTNAAFEPQALTLQKQEVTLSNKRVVKQCVFSPAALVGNASEFAHLMGCEEEQRKRKSEEEEDEWLENELVFV